MKPSLHWIPFSKYRSEYLLEVGVNILHHNILTPSQSIRNVNHGIALSVICKRSGDVWYSVVSWIGGSINYNTVSWLTD